MYSKFAEIKHINDVLPHIDERFIVAEKDEYTVINYILPDKETFPEEDSLRSQIRLECRGIIFCNKTGSILRRPYQKFFNLGERDSLSYNAISSQGNANILEKLDGSMISPFVTHSGKMIWGTKMGETHLTPKVEAFLHGLYEVFARELISRNFTPIFEWMNPEDRIVLDYGDHAKLVLVAIRNMFTGEYHSYSQMVQLATIYSIPVVNMLTEKAFSEDFIESVKSEEGIEGYVVRFDNGNMCKIKCEWYCTIHKAKSYLTKERHVVELILEQKLDDLKSLLLKDDLERLEAFEISFHKAFTTLVAMVETNLAAVHFEKISRKEFALKYLEHIPKWLANFIFKHFDEPINKEELVKTITNYIVSKCNRDITYSDFIIGDILKDMERWNPVRIDEV